MAKITDYNSLVTAVTDYLARSDLTPFIPNFIQNTEEKLYGTLRIRTMETALTGTIANGVLAVPADYLELKYIYLDSSPVVFLERTTPEIIYTKYRSNSGRPLEIAREADNFIFGPTPDGSYDVAGIYYKKLTALSTSNTTNWFTANAPELLLYGALLEAQPFIRNDARIATWQTLFDQSYMRVDRQNKRERTSGSTLATRTA